jgi:AcrR family transcriptional regulator
LARRLKTDPRKSPRQSRSQETVDAILAATERLLGTSGYDTMSTNRIALAAGVSIGSLYQYFPSKEAIVAALVERHCLALSQVSHATLAAHADSPLEVTARAVVQAMIAARGVKPKLMQALREQVPRVGKLKMIDGLHAGTVAAVTRYLETHRRELKLRDPELTAFFAVKTVDALLQQMLDPIMADRGVERVSDEIVKLLVAYIKGGG